MYGFGTHSTLFGIKVMELIFYLYNAAKECHLRDVIDEESTRARQEHASEQVYQMLSAMSHSEYIQVYIYMYLC